MSRLTAPLGMREGERLEFKRANALQALETIGKSVVAFLNSHGGTLWIGVVEEHEQAVALEDVGDIDGQRRRLEDYLIDSIEPSPDTKEVSVSAVSAGDRRVIRVEVSDESRHKPYALLKRGSWRAYPIRVGARTRPMSREDLAARFKEADVRSDEARKKVESAWNDELQSGRTGLWATVVPSQHLALTSDASLRERLDEALHDPSLTGNRRMGWNFCSQYESFRPAGRKVVAGGPDSYTWTEITLDGAITFRAPRPNLEHVKEGELYPLALIEYPTSVLRLAAWLYDSFVGPNNPLVVADVGLVGVAGMKLRPGMPGTVAHELHQHELDEEVLRAGPHDLEAHSLKSNPDDGAWRLLHALYAAAGLWSDQMPNALFDEERRTLSFPT